MALITDSAIGLVASIFGARLWNAHRMWALSFVFTAVAAFAGGVFHGFGDQNLVLWKVTVMAVGIASFFLLAGTDRRLAIIAVILLVVYVPWMTAHDAFVYVVANYGITLILIAIFHPAKNWIFGCIAVSIAGAIVQQTRIAIDPQWFDHNDLYHVIQMVALWMLFRAARERSASEPEVGSV